MPLTSPVDFLARKFDYLIVGGGTAGLVVAARLSENPALTVGVLEAGPVALGVETIDIPGLYGQTLGTDYDWKFETIPQPGLDGRTLAWPRGKVLGGTSALNFMTWNRASREDHDAWRDLGNKGWGWDDLLPYFKKTENFHTPEEFNQKANSLYYDKQAVGESGPIQVGYASEYSSSHQLWLKTMQSLGVESNRAHLAGSNVGVWTNLGSVDPHTGTRSYSTTTYCLPNASRPNLLVLTEACVTEIVLEKDDGEWTAKGVRFQRDGSSFFAAASREVIISAGSVQSPQILELSGIGNPDILSKARISVKVSNPNVGENLQDHIMAALIFEVDSTLSTPDDLKQHKAAADAARHQFRASRTGPLTILPNSICYLPFSHFVPSHQLRALSEEAGSITTIPDLERAIRQDRLAPSSAAKLGQIEYIFDLGNWNPFFQPPPSSYKKYATCLQILQYPFSKGSIHISSNNIADKPMIDPQYYGGTHGGPIDLSLMVHAARFAAYRIAQALPLAGIIRRRVFPPQVPVEDEDESFWRDWLTQTTITDWHPVGTCAMGGRIGMNPAGGGVVDDRLRVYGTKGLRVVDASVMPLQISAHLQATVYAIGEKGAAMILEDAQFENE
ncbi:hypothetical protein JX265_011530 [Neoarthrinium moseri]|uniref:Glucose-methanol-choline oxidoreductase N-terminal domain-containing protein n=1 Tax=Neoarthrinium moseri TaxID=1658444 RepID=A0A9Q0AJJ4_9PEZI|nr:hypothetical protein JX265_011530 [Neoarthrinium moseri]